MKTTSCSLTGLVQIPGKEDGMRKLMKKLEDLMVAITFAEASEYDEAQRLAGGRSDQQEAPEPVHGGKNQAVLDRGGGK